MSECRDKEGGGMGERFGPRSVDGCCAVVPSADPSPNPLLDIMTAMIDVKPTTDQLLNLFKGFTERVP